MEIKIAIKAIGITASTISPQTACYQQISVVKNPGSIVAVANEKAINRKRKTERVGYAQTGNQFFI
jgi:hypothetical protein